MGKLSLKISSADDGQRKSYICLPSPALNAPRDAEAVKKYMAERPAGVDTVPEDDHIEGMTDVDVRTQLVMMEFMEYLEADQLDALGQLFEIQSFDAQVANFEAQAL